MTQCYHFLDFDLRPLTRELCRGRQQASIGGRALDLLIVLVEHRGELVEHAELTRRVWPGLVVAPNNLQVQVWRLRRLLGGDAIASIARRGYRFVPEVSDCPEPDRATDDAPDAAGPETGADAESAIARVADAIDAIVLDLASHRALTIVVSDDAQGRVLARQICVRMRESLPGGAWIVRHVPRALPARGCPLAGRPGVSSLDHLTRRIGARRALVALLDWETWTVPAGEVVAAFLRECPDAMVLAVGREVLDYPGERVRVGPRRSSRITRADRRST